MISVHVQANLYATPTDMLLFLEELEAKRSINYSLAEPSEEPRAKRWASCGRIPGLGVANAPQTSLCRSYLITERASEVVPRKVLQSGGGTLFFTDQLLNPDSLVLTPGESGEVGSSSRVALEPLTTVRCRGR
jgi:hypothetical protein